MAKSKQENCDDLYELARDYAQAEAELGVQHWVFIEFTKDAGDESSERIFSYDLPREVYERRRWVVRWREAAMDNKGAWKNRSAFCTFTSYAARDHELLTRRQAEAERGRLYTYLQMVQLLPTNGGNYRAEDFETVQTPQGVRWRIRTPRD